MGHGLKNRLSEKVFRHFTIDKGCAQPQKTNREFGRGSPQEKRGNVFGHFLTLTPQLGGQICVIQTGFMEGVFSEGFSERDLFASKTPVMKPVWFTQIWPPG